MTRSSLKETQPSSSPQKPPISQVACVELPRVSDVYQSISSTSVPLPSISHSTPIIIPTTTTSITTASISGHDYLEANPTFASFLASINLSHLTVPFVREGFITADDLAALRSSDVRTQFQILDRLRNSMGSKFSLADMLVLMTEVQK